MSTSTLMDLGLAAALCVLAGLGIGAFRRFRRDRRAARTSAAMAELTGRITRRVADFGHQLRWAISPDGTFLGGCLRCPGSVEVVPARQPGDADIRYGQEIGDADTPLLCGGAR